MYAVSVACIHLHAGMGDDLWIVITELHKNPEGPESSRPGGLSHEFIEVANFGSEAFDVKGVLLTDGQEQDTIIPWEEPHPGHPNCITGQTLLQPGRFALILDRNYADADLPAFRYYDIADSTLLLTVGDAELGGSTGLSDGEGVLLYTGTKTEIQTPLSVISDNAVDLALVSFETDISQSAGVTEGVSIIPRALLTDQTALGVSPVQTSPGTYEMMRRGYILDWQLSLNSGDNLIEARIIGYKAGDMPKGAHYRILAVSSSGRQQVTSGAWPQNDPTLEVKAAFSVEDTKYLFELDLIDTVLAFTIPTSQVWVPLSSIVISELFPRGTLDTPEWIELYNASFIDINLEGWLFGLHEDRDLLSASELVIPAGGFLVTAKNAEHFSRQYPACPKAFEPETWYSLDNYTDTLCLWHASGRLQECAAWDYTWFDGWGKQSLERMFFEKDGRNQAAWVLADKPSPGQPNANVHWRARDDAEISIGPVPFTPNGNGKNDLLAIHVVLPPDATLDISLYGYNGLQYTQFSGFPRPRYLWDGKMDNGESAPNGPFFVVVKIRKGSKYQTIRKKGVLWR